MRLVWLGVACAFLLVTALIVQMAWFLINYIALLAMLMARGQLGWSP